MSSVSLSPVSLGGVSVQCHQCHCHPSVLAVSPCPDPATEVGPEGGREFLPLFCGLLVLLGAMSLGVKPVISGSV